MIRPQRVNFHSNLIGSIITFGGFVLSESYFALCLFFQVFMIYQSQNAMVKHFIRKGIVTDIARITNHIDLSSSHVPATINAALKPLEILSRAVNCPTVYKKKGDNDDAASNVQEEASVSQHSTSSNLDSCVQSLIRTIGNASSSITDFLD